MPKGSSKVFTTKRERESEKIDRIIYGGDSSKAKLDYLQKNNSIFDELNHSQNLIEEFLSEIKKLEFHAKVVFDNRPTQISCRCKRDRQAS